MPRVIPMILTWCLPVVEAAPDVIPMRPPRHRRIRGGGLVAIPMPRVQRISRTVWRVIPIPPSPRVGKAVGHVTRKRPDAQVVQIAQIDRVVQINKADRVVQTNKADRVVQTNKADRVVPGIPPASPMAKAIEGGPVL